MVANNAWQVAQGNAAFEQRDRALRQTVREEVHRELIPAEGSSASHQSRAQDELVRARHGEEHSVEDSRQQRSCGGPLSVLGGSGARRRPYSC